MGEGGTLLGNTVGTDMEVSVSMLDVVVRVGAIACIKCTAGSARLSCPELRGHVYQVFSGLVSGHGQTGGR